MLISVVLPPPSQVVLHNDHNSHARRAARGWSYVVASFFACNSHSESCVTTDATAESKHSQALYFTNRNDNVASNRKHRVASNRKHIALRQIAHAVRNRSQPLRCIKSHTSCCVKSQTLCVTDRNHRVASNRNRRAASNRSLALRQIASIVLRQIAHAVRNRSQPLRCVKSHTLCVGSAGDIVSTSADPYVQRSCASA
mgnify:CR=1 FL=1